jgi:hypothetical protein
MIEKVPTSPFTSCGAREILVWRWSWDRLQLGNMVVEGFSLTHAVISTARGHAVALSVRHSARY